MKGTISLKIAPTIEPVTATEVKLHMRVDISTDDTLISNLITAARRWIETLTGIRMVTQTWYWYHDAFPGESSLEIPIGPVTAVSSIKYTPVGGVATTFASGNYSTDLESLPARIVLKDGCSWPSDTLEVVNGVVVEFIAGYAIASSLPTTPKELQQAVNLLVAYWYENREAASERDVRELPMALQHIIENFRMWQR